MVGKLHLSTFACLHEPNMVASGLALGLCVRVHSAGAAWQLSPLGPRAPSRSLPRRVPPAAQPTGPAARA
jgi:hypothetical protein